MNLPRVCAGILFCFLSSLLVAQDQFPSTKKHKFSIYGGGGPNHYFNNIVQLKSQVNEFNYSFAARIMWEPEHNLSLGIETGYYRLYSLDVKKLLKKTNIKNSAIPIQVVLSMKFLKTFYFNFSMGRSILINDITSDAHGNFDATTFSWADFASSVGYRHKLNDRFSLSAEAKFYYASKADDKNLALLFLFGYRL